MKKREFYEQSHQLKHGRKLSAIIMKHKFSPSEIQQIFDTAERKKIKIGRIKEYAF